MPNYIYVALVDDAKISVLTIDVGSGKLSPKADIGVDHRCRERQAFA